MGDNERVRAAETYVRAFRSGEPTAVRRLEEMLSNDPVVAGQGGEIAGRDLVLDHVRGQWPMTPALALGGFGEPRRDGDGTFVVEGEIHNLGAAPKAVTLRFHFDEHDALVRVDEHTVPVPSAKVGTEIPLLVRGLLNAALAVGRPVVFAYVAEDGSPSQSLRGSVQVFSPTQLCLWVRPGSRAPSALAANRRVSLLYRDSTTRTTLIVTGAARISTDDTVRRRVFELSPEVEQRHDPEMDGTAVLIEVIELRGTTPQGAVLVRPAG